MLPGSRCARASVSEGQFEERVEVPDRARLEERTRECAKMLDVSG